MNRGEFISLSVDGLHFTKARTPHIELLASVLTKLQITAEATKITRNIIMPEFLKVIFCSHKGQIHEILKSRAPKYL